MFSTFEDDMLAIAKSGKIVFYQPFDYHIDNRIAIMVLSKINDFNLEEHESTHMVDLFLFNYILLRLPKYFFLNRFLAV